MPPTQAARCAEGVESDNMEEDLTHLQLRRLYDDEEIERFLSTFSGHAMEATLPSLVFSKQFKEQASVPRTNKGVEQVFCADNAQVEDSDPETDTGGPWTYFHNFNPSAEALSERGAQENTTSPSLMSQKKRPFLLPRSQPKALSAHVAAWIIHKLPRIFVPPRSNFRASSARFAGQRLYVAACPIYTPLVAELAALAAWTNWNHSACVCSAWWTLWYFDLLLPALLSKVLFSLLRRRIFLYPNLKELKQRRTIARSASQLSASFEDYGAGASFFGTGPLPRMSQIGADMGNRDMLRLARTVTKGKVKKAKEKTGSVVTSMSSQLGLSAEPDEETQAKRHQAEVGDWRQSMLRALEGIADFHERVRNVHFWRYEKRSWIYASALAITLLLVVATPTQLLAKITYAFIGVTYWFVVPVLLAIPPEDRRRIPLPLYDVPTDAEYTISLMSLRAANGESVIPPSCCGRGENHRARKSPATVSNPGADMDPSVCLENQKDGSTTEPSGSGTDKLVVPLQTIGVPQSTPATHKAVPGVLCLDSNALSFTPMLTSTPRLCIHVEKIQSVKRTHRTNGLRVRHLTERGYEKEDVFRLVLKRDEIFVELQKWGDGR